MNIVKKKNFLFPNKDINKCTFQIPAHIFQTWHSKILPPLMMVNILNIKKNNPNFKYFLFDDEECRDFIKNNYSEEIVNAYDSLVPGAYKADLWRYCILYKMGGIYMDISYRPINGFKLYNLLEKEHLVTDIDKNCVYNALMVCKPGNPILISAINKICENIKNKYYGSSPLYPTGPGLMGSYFKLEEKLLFDMRHVNYTNKDYDRVIKFNNHDVLSCYPGYFTERLKSSKTKHYVDYWNERKIYK